ncbi:MAG: site-specific DNA-methyltransferase [Acidobacteria bacterium]|nr:MAG: site-specific DNA-methyltransferase [Acidobacteriota bacterium]
MRNRQLHLFEHRDDVESQGADLEGLLSQDLNFHSETGTYASHDFHPFPAKFPPQLPHKFITALTSPGEIVLDPMMGSGTTVLEAFLCGRQGIGIDIDPLALKISSVKATPLNVKHVLEMGHEILQRARMAVAKERSDLKTRLEKRWDRRTRQFIDYWFTRDTQLELMALIGEIEKIPDVATRRFFEVVFSGTIITKSGGVSLALDLAHTRPHRAKVVLKATSMKRANNAVEASSRRHRHETKMLRSAILEFEKRFKQNLGGLAKLAQSSLPPRFLYGNAQNLPLLDASVDLIVTSPPYASNAIDYMRAHKFSLVWMGYSIEELGRKRKEYIGGEATTDFQFEELPHATAKVVADIAERDQKKGRALHRYYSEMTRILREMHRVLRPGKIAIVIIGSSVMRGRDTETPMCLAEIGRALGFHVPKIGIRQLDRDRRMMPVGSRPNLDSQIQQRMHEEYVIGFRKPDTLSTAPRRRR